MTVQSQIRRFGADETRRYYQSQVDAVELVRDLGRDEGIDFQLQGDGEFTVAPSPRAFRALQTELDLHRRVLGLKASLLSREAFLERGYASPEQFGALRLEPTFGLHPMRYVLGLARAAERRGAVLHPHTCVDQWRKHGSDHLLETAGGRLRAKRVIIACNGFMPEHLHRTLVGRPLPLQSNIVVTRPLTRSELEAHQWRNSCPTIEARHMYVFNGAIRARPLKRGTCTSISECFPTTG